MQHVVYLFFHLLTAISLKRYYPWYHSTTVLLRHHTSNIWRGSLHVNVLKSETLYAVMDAMVAWQFNQHA